MSGGVGAAWLREREAERPVIEASMRTAQTPTPGPARPTTAVFSSARPLFQRRGPVDSDFRSLER